ncbi:hypothetical protein GGD56_005885 [Rhizobium mongolense]|jgi:hypothetical protein|uniref:Uncharacterized protein n=1 Tax=Rhizobium mongolense TaxID=57676 RepID=A0ABR6IWT6_9HYPH|nr:hypothetical protein [Rhizobium mongolense]
MLHRPPAAVLTEEFVIQNFTPEENRQLIIGMTMRARKS